MLMLPFSLDQDEIRPVISQRRTLGQSFNGTFNQSSSDIHEHSHVVLPDSAENDSTIEDDDPLSSAENGQQQEVLLASGHYKQAISDLKRKIMLLEKQTEFSGRNEHHVRFAESLSIAGASYESQLLLENGSQGGPIPPQILPQICERSWSDFMNKHVAEPHEYAIEVLAGDPEYHRKKESERFEWRQTNGRNIKPESQPLKKLVPSQASSTAAAVPERIRINSPWILHILAGIDQHIDATGPIIMLRPFKFLIHFESQIKDSISMLQDQIDKSTAALSHGEMKLSSSSQPTASIQEDSAAFQQFENRRMTVQHMQCLVRFIEEYIKPTTGRLDNNEDGKIRFSDLWYVFRPGDNIYIPLRLPRGPVSVDAVTTTPEMIQSRYNMMWRCAGTGGGRPNLSSAQSRSASLKPNPFKVNCFYIDFDGKYFCPVSHTFSIMPFKGERDITSLELFPVRFMKEPEKTTEDHFNKGKMVYDCIIASYTHYYYVGPTLVAQPCGCRVQHENHEPLHQEHVESEVIVDFRMTLIKQPSWRPKSSIGKVPIERKELQDLSPVQYWSDPQRLKLNSTENDNIYDDHFVDEERAAILRNHEKIFSPVPSDWLSNEEMVPAKDMLLMPGRVFAFILRSRTFGLSTFARILQLAPLWLWLLQPIKPQFEGLRNLQLRDDNFKDTIQALVRTHFIQKKAQQKSDFEYDVVRGKVFLRVLEYYGGVIFLTTNRLGVLDDAIRSRITWIAYYPPLDKSQTLKIWKVNLKLIEERYKNLQIDRRGILKFAKEHFLARSADDPAWNGRQIQNAFKVAAALAEWDAYSNDLRHNVNTKTPEEEMHSQPSLVASHFNTIAEGTQAFNSYLQETIGFTEAERAYNAMERADHYGFDENANDGGSIAFPPHIERSRSPSYPSPTSAPLPRKSRSSFSIDFPSSNPYAHALYNPHSLGQNASHRRTSVSNQIQNQAHLPPDVNNLSPPPSANPSHSQSRRRSSSQLIAKAASALDSSYANSPSPRNSKHKSSHKSGHTLSNTTATAATVTTVTKAQNSHSSRHGKRPSIEVSPDTEIANRGPQNDPNQSDETRSMSNSSSEEDFNGKERASFSDSDADSEE
ncbi:MAG: hypothetical protein Q9227_001042 [Pyrenula ochraceoflavens]